MSTPNHPYGPQQPADPSAIDSPTTVNADPLADPSSTPEQAPFAATPVDPVAPVQVKRGFGARVGGFVRHRATQIVAALVIGLGLGAGGMAIILHGGGGGHGGHGDKGLVVTRGDGGSWDKHPFGPRDGGPGRVPTCQAYVRHPVGTGAPCRA